MTPLRSTAVSWRLRGTVALTAVGVACGLVVVAPAPSRAQSAPEPRLVVGRALNEQVPLAHQLAAALAQNLRERRLAVVEPPPSPSVPPHGASLQRARELFDNLRPEQARRLLAGTLASIENQGGQGLSRPELLEALFLLSLCSLALNEPDRAQDAVDRALVMDPEVTLPPERYPPTLRELLERRRTALSSLPRARLQVTGAAGALLLLDGSEQGSLPASLEVRPGLHLMTVTQAGMLPFAQRLSVPPGGVAIQVNLRPDPAALLRSPGPPGADPTALVDAAGSLGASLVLFDLVSGDRALEVSVTDVATGRVARAALDSAQSLGPVAAELARQLAETPSDHRRHRRLPWIVAGVTVGAAVVATIVTVLLVPRGDAETEGRLLEWSR